MGLGDVGQDIEEMAVLCHELLNSDIPTTSLTGFIMGLVRAVSAQIGRFNERQETSDKVIDCLRESNRRLPDSHDVSNPLAWSLYDRFRIAYSNDDYEAGSTILDRVIHAPVDGLTQHNCIEVGCCVRAGSILHVREAGIPRTGDPLHQYVARRGRS
jgi:hypothetical protein